MMNLIVFFRNSLFRLFTLKKPAKSTILFLFASVSLHAQHDPDLAAIRQVTKQQVEAWNRADLEQFMAGYWRSDSLQFIGSNGIRYGWQAILDNYRKSYASPEAMGKLTFTILTLEKLSATSAWMIGKWHLKRAHDEPAGHFMLIWKKINGRWVIVADHSS